MDDGGGEAETSPVLVVSGPPGAGKSTVAKLLAVGGTPPTVCIEADWFWTTIKTGFVPPWEPASDHQNQTVLRSVASAAAGMANGGYDVVLDGVVGPWHLPVLIDVMGGQGLAIDYVVLRPDLATCLARGAGRTEEVARVPGHPPLTDSGPIRHMWHQLADLGPYEPHVLDTTDLTAGATVDQVLQMRDRGTSRVRLEPPGGTLRRHEERND